MIFRATEKFTIIELSREDVRNAFAKAQSLGVRGGLVHDLLHATAAEKAGAVFICTFNESDFRLLTSIPLGLY